MKVAAAIAVLPLLAGAAPTVAQPQEKRTLLLLGSLLGGLFGKDHTFQAGSSVGWCDEGQVSWAGQKNGQDYFRWGQSSHPAPLGVCIAPASGFSKREASTEVAHTQEKRTLGLLLSLTQSLIGFKVRLLGGLVGTITNGCYQMSQNRFTWEGKVYHWKLVNWRGEHVYTCDSDGHDYVFVPCKGNEDTSTDVDDDSGCCNACGGCSPSKRSLNDLE